MKIQKFTNSGLLLPIPRRSGKKFSLSAFALLALSGSAWSQQNTGAAALEATGTGGSVSATLGQISYSSITSPAGTVSQGVQQAYEIFTLGVDKFPDIQLSVNIFPNPTTNLVTLAVEGTSDGLSFVLTDVTGKQLQQSPLDGPFTSIRMETYPPGTYILEVRGAKNIQKTFKIIKN
ncbi:MAG: hypothetical protein K0S23_928 [Fluviicola sp.]|jgi:hypothetical protein|uniref:T9SS type A sorting domain-containing protein n=1 Tax=Fluviicola sp. TaxID=1917219 RepID=UPI0026182AA7|nr:T9SS type A sorting domain-containing protein [Fluviicola sp.]MDF3026621.1 hypothetical protein [Fluviicola sp.]